MSSKGTTTNVQEDKRELQLSSIMPKKLPLSFTNRGVLVLAEALVPDVVVSPTIGAVFCVCMAWFTLVSDSWTFWASWLPTRFSSVAVEPCMAVTTAKRTKFSRKVIFHRDDSWKLWMVNRPGFICDDRSHRPIASDCYNRGAFEARFHLVILNYI